MEKEQIVKALECCTRKPRANCKECPYALAEDRCMVSKLQRDSLSLIRDQEKRIEELTLENVGFEAGAKAAAKFIRADTVRKMQEMLLAKKVTYGNITFRVVPVDDIDQIANQLLEETK